jgi:hypothetical protein
MSYCQRGKVNPFDAHMAGCSIWYSPRQILILEKALDAIGPALTDVVDREALEDMLPLIRVEADIKRKKYFGG